jgi:hypothetical protein
MEPATSSPSIATQRREFDHRVDRLDFPPGLGVIENGLVRPELVGDGASRLVEFGLIAIAVVQHLR